MFINYWIEKCTVKHWKTRSSLESLLIIIAINEDSVNIRRKILTNSASSYSFLGQLFNWFTSHFLPSLSLFHFLCSCAWSVRRSVQTRRWNKHNSNGIAAPFLFLPKNATVLLFILWSWLIFIFNIITFYDVTPCSIIKMYKLQHFYKFPL